MIKFELLIPNQTKPNLLKAEGPMVTNTAKSNITYTEIKTKCQNMSQILVLTL